MLLFIPKSNGVSKDTLKPRDYIIVAYFIRVFMIIFKGFQEALKG